MSDHTHRLTYCHECGGEGVGHPTEPGLCPTCDGRGYLEQCSICGEPMGNARRKWKREQREQ